MNIAQASALVQRLTDQQLQQEMAKPSGMAPLYVVSAEIQRRAQMRAQSQAAQPQPKAFAEGGLVSGDGFFDPSQLAGLQERFMADYASKMGLGAGVPATLEDQIKRMQGLMPDTSSPVFEKILAAQQKDYDEIERANRGRPLMEMGLAMMQSKGGNFWDALGRGGTAALSAKDRVSAQQKHLMQGLLQTQMAKAQADAGRNAAVMQAATGERNTDRSVMSQGLGMAQAHAGQIGQLQNARAEGVQRDRISSAELASRERIAGMDRAAQLEAARISANRNRTEGKPSGWDDAYDLYFKQMVEGEAARPGAGIDGVKYEDLDRRAREMADKRYGLATPKIAHPDDSKYQTGKAYKTPKGMATYLGGGQWKLNAK